MTRPCHLYAILLDRSASPDTIALYKITGGFGGILDASISSGTLDLNSETRGGWAQVLGIHDDDYMIQLNPSVSAGGYLDVYLRAQDPNNGYRPRFEDGLVDLQVIEDGDYAFVSSGSLFSCSSPPYAMKINLSGCHWAGWNRPRLGGS